MATGCPGGVVTGVASVAASGLAASAWKDRSVAVSADFVTITANPMPLFTFPAPTRGMEAYFVSAAEDGGAAPHIPAGSPPSGGAGDGDGGRLRSARGQLPSTFYPCFVAGLFDRYHRFSSPEMLAGGSHIITDFLSSFESLEDVLDALPGRYGELRCEARVKARDRGHPVCEELMAATLMASLDIRDEFDLRYSNMRPSRSKAIFVFHLIDGALSKKDLFRLSELFIAVNGFLLIDEADLGPSDQYLYVQAPCRGKGGRPSLAIQDVIKGIIREKDKILERP